MARRVPGTPVTGRGAAGRRLSGHLARSPATDAPRRRLTMPRYAARDLGKLDELTNHLESAPDRDGIAAAVPLIRELLDADAAGFYAVVPSNDGLAVDHVVVHAGTRCPGAEEAIRACFADTRRRSALRDLLHPRPQERNVPLRAKDVVCRRPGSDAVCPVRSHVGLSDDADHLRVLVCEGPTLLAWVGGFRERPFTPRERRLLARAVPPLRRRLALERRLALATAAALALDVATESIPTATFLVRSEGSGVVIEHANAPGRAWIESRCCTRLAEIGAAVRAPDAPGPYAVSPLPGVGGDAYHLVVRRAPADDPAPRANAVARRLQLTERQAEVLDRVVLGDTNKEIADWLGCAPGTVEMHVTAILRRTGADSRARLIARFFTDRL